MTKLKPRLNLLVCMLFGFLGGMIANNLSHVDTATAQQEAQVIRARSFEVVDTDGQVLADLKQRGMSNSSLIFYDSKGRDRLTVGMTFVRNEVDKGYTARPVIFMKDSEGKVIWQAR